MLPITSIVRTGLKARSNFRYATFSHISIAVGRRRLIQRTGLVNGLLDMCVCNWKSTYFRSNGPRTESTDSLEQSLGSALIVTLETNMLRSCKRAVFSGIYFIRIDKVQLTSKARYTLLFPFS